MREILEKEIDKVILNKKIREILKLNQINTICNLCQNSRMELVSLGLTNNQVNEIVVEMQLHGLDLKPNHAKRNLMIDKYIKHK